MPDAFGNPTVAESLATAAASWGPQLYYPITVFGSRMWVPVPLGSSRHPLARPRDQIPAGEDIRDPGMETVGPGGITPSPPPVGPLIPATTPPPPPVVPPPVQPPADDGVPTERAARLLAGALRGNPFLQASGLARLESGRAPLLGEIQSPFWGVTSPTVQQSLMGLYQAMGLPPQDVRHTFSMWKIPGLGW